MNCFIRLFLSLTMLVATQSAFASNLAIPPCDTIITKSGQRLLVNIVSADSTEIQYRYCKGNATEKLRTMPRARVASIKRSAKALTSPVEEDTAEKTPPTEPISDEQPAKDDVKIIRTKSDTLGMTIDLDPFKDDNPIEGTTEEQRKLTRWAKWGAVCSWSTLFLYLFAASFHYIWLVLVIPAFIIGLIYSLKAYRGSSPRRRTGYKKIRKLSGWALIILIWPLVLGGLAFVVSLIALLFI